MKRQRYNFDDLLMQLRQKDINNIADVEYAILETSGELSIVKRIRKRNKSKFLRSHLLLMVKFRMKILLIAKFPKCGFEES